MSEDEYDKLFTKFYSDLFKFQSGKKSNLRCAGCSSEKIFIIDDDKLTYSCGPKNSQNKKCGPQYTIILPQYNHFRDLQKMYDEQMNGSFNYREKDRLQYDLKSLSLKMDLKDDLERQTEVIKESTDKLKKIIDDSVTENKLTEYAERTKTDLALLQQRPDGKVDEESGKTEKEIAIDKVRKRDRGVSWTARDKMRKISEQLRTDFNKIGNEYAPQIKTINTRIQELRQQAQLKTEDLDAKIIQLERFIEKEQDIVDDIREDKLVLEQAYRELEVEVGPVKYIAEFIYGDNAVGMLDSAVRGVILLLIFVFDPLAVLLVIAGNLGNIQTMSKQFPDSRSVNKILKIYIK
jgi:hypothetical protein